MVIMAHKTAPAGLQRPTQGVSEVGFGPRLRGSLSDIPLSASESHS